MTKKTFYIILFAMLTATSLLAESFNISGRVVDEQGIPLKGASLRIENTNLGTFVKDSAGKFKIINIPGTEAILKVSFTGMESKRFIVTKDSINMLIVLKDGIIEFYSNGCNFSKMVDNSSIGSIVTLSKERIQNTSSKRLSGSYYYPKVYAYVVKETNDINSKSSIDKNVVKEYSNKVYITEDKAYPKSSEKIDFGLLTAGEVNDFTKWNLWTDISNNELAVYQKLWNFTPQERYTVLFQTNSKFPLYGAKVVLKEGNKNIWESVTDNTGKAELWNNAFNTKNPASNNLTIEINYDNKNYEIKNPKLFHDGINFVFSDMIYKSSLEADIAFVVDATNSMSDELEYLKSDLTNIINGIKDSIPSIDLNIGSVFYRDYMEEFSSKYSDMTNDFNKTMTFIKSVKAGGGHKISALQIGLITAINQLQWRENSVAKIIFLLLDASPKTDKNTIDSIMNLTQFAAKKGIRIVPVACSGIDKSGEYLLRSMALLTNGTYTFLTDDSHIGDSHIKPTTDKYEVETFNALLKRLIKQYLTFPKSDLVINNLKADTTKVEALHNIQKDINKTDTLQKNSSVKPENNEEKLSIKCYPNPTSGNLNIETYGKIEELFISDVSGKLMTRTEVNNQNNITLSLSNYPNGTYYALCIYDKDKILKGKFIIIH